MCVWDGTYTLSEEEREALDQVPGWNDDAVSFSRLYGGNVSLAKSAFHLADRAARQ